LALAPEIPSGNKSQRLGTRLLAVNHVHGLNVSSLQISSRRRGAKFPWISFFAALPIAVLGLKNEEGNILKETFIPTLVYGIILAALAGLWLLVS
jgi:hypothetical protein